MIAKIIYVTLFLGFIIFLIGGLARQVDKSMKFADHCSKELNGVPFRSMYNSKEYCISRDYILDFKNEKHL